MDEAVRKGLRRSNGEGGAGKKGIYDYETAWNWAMPLRAEERAARFKEIVKSNSNQR
jgi:hypothetical protein